MAGAVRGGGRGELDQPAIATPGNTAPPSGLERVVRQDRALVAFGIVAVTILAWLYLVRMAAMMNTAAADKALHAAMGMPEMAAWGRDELVMLFLMWAVMMIAMMLPSAAPIILLVVGTYRRRGAGAPALTAMFAAGYVFAWTAFSAAAALTQLALHRAAVLSVEMASNSALIGGGVLMLAGAYQWLPLKQACLTHCRSPLTFLTHEWREGAAGALRMGWRHGLYCVGCCWALMLSLFVAGVMNLLWVAVIALFVLVEKVAPRGAQLGRVAGGVLFVWGGWLLTRGLLT
jgi:predicted metal-binding membrane protein